MSGMLKQITVALFVFAAACTPSHNGTTTQATQNANANGTLRFSAPAGWVEEKPNSASRVAQYKLPKVAEDTEDASAILYFFGQGQGGGTAANIDRWVNQMEQSDGSSSKEKAKEDSMTVNGLKVTTVDVTGTYTAEMAPGSGTFHNNSNYRLRAAVIETPKGSYYLKLVGPEKTVAKWDSSVTEFIKSMEFK
jgi:hypothetical protein